MSKHKIKSIIHKKFLEDRDLDIGEDQKLETSTLGEIVSLEKSNKNVNGLRILTSYQSMMGYDWSYQAKEESTDFALMAFSSSGSSSSDTEASQGKRAWTLR
nr:hypothetical protein [Tanacetum cinerariifolium]